MRQNTVLPTSTPSPGYSSYTAGHNWWSGERAINYDNILLSVLVVQSVTANGNIVCGHQNFPVTAVWSVWWGRIKPSFFVPCLNCGKHQALTHCVLVSWIFLLLSFCLWLSCYRWAMGKGWAAAVGGNNYFPLVEHSTVCINSFSTFTRPLSSPFLATCIEQVVQWHPQAAASHNFR